MLFWKYIYFFPQYVKLMFTWQNVESKQNQNFESWNILIVLLTYTYINYICM